MFRGRTDGVTPPDANTPKEKGTGDKPGTQMYGSAKLGEKTRRIQRWQKGISVKLEELSSALRKIVEAKLAEGSQVDPLVQLFLGPIICPIRVMGKPRMTQRDKWANRPAVVRYHNFKTRLRSYFDGHMVNLDDVRQLSWVAYIAMPDSWSAKQKKEMSGKPHLQKPDRDNIDKAVLDALFGDDSKIWRGSTEKRWDDGNGERLEIKLA
jgi:Holliday junction resolvase RusA-like endonuclease